MADQDLTPSLLPEKAPVAVPQIRAKSAPEVWRQVIVTIPEAVAAYADRVAQVSGRSAEQVLAELVADGLDAKLAEGSRGTAGSCPDGRLHQRGTLNVRHCARCGARMP